jgi:ADP-heptose:LPS heptosyltransferase
VKTVPLVTDLADLDPKKYTLFCSEQGIGDQVLFMGALQEALQDYPRAAIIAEERMVALLQRSFPQVKVYPYAFVLGLTKQTKRLNGVFPIGSLMRHYRPSARSFGNTPEQYLKVSQVHHQKYGALLRDSISSKEIIGISWSGGFWDRQIRTKSIDFETLVRGLMQGEDRRLVCLQYGDTTKERELSKKNGWPVTFINGMDFKKDIDGWVAVAAACDRIVSVSTALVHFMGAIGKRVDLLLSDKQAPFIWGVSEGQSLPYKSVTIWRKKEAETFSELIKRMDA